MALVTLNAFDLILTSQGLNLGTLFEKPMVTFKIVGASLSGMSIDPKSVSIYPAVKAPVEFSSQVTSGDYILWNTLGKCPFAATVKV